MDRQFNLSKLRKFISLCLAFIFILAVSASPLGLKPDIRGYQSYIVQGKDTKTLTSLVEKYQGRVTSQLEIIQGVGALLLPGTVSSLKAEPGVSAITPNAPVRVADDEVGKGSDTPATDYPNVAGADVVWGAGVNGSGVTVAIVDTGLTNHRAITRDADGKKGRIIGWVDFVDGSKNITDPNGHGTHVAGIIAGSQTGADGEWTGVAPGVNLVGVRVLDAQGGATYERVIQGVQWVINNKAQYNIRVLNLSLVTPPSTPYFADPLNQAVTRAWAEGITVVAAAGNAGPGPMTIGVPGNNPYVITVGAFTDHYTPNDWSDDYLTPFSSAGPTLDAFVKPDLVAPGAHMPSPMRPSSTLAKEYPAGRLANQYYSMAGTSQSAALTTGVVALMLQQNPALTPNEVKYRLMITAYPWVNLETTDALYSVWQQGAGRINAPDAVFADNIEGVANHNMDIWADLNGTTHYQGFTTVDPVTGEFKLEGYGNWSGGYGNWSGGYGNWSGGYGNWSGGYGNWSGGYGNWSGGYGNWSGGYGNWSGGYGNWSGGYGNWSGGYGNWSGGYLTWGGGYGNWSGGYGNWSGGYGNWSGGYGNWSGSYGNWSGTIPWIGVWFGDQP